LSSKVWITKKIADILDQAVIDSAVVNHRFSRHLHKLDVITRMIAEGRVNTSKDLERIERSLSKTAMAMHSAKQALKNNDGDLY